MVAPSNRGMLAPYTPIRIKCVRLQPRGERAIFASSPSPKKIYFTKHTLLAHTSALFKSFRDSKSADYVTALCSAVVQPCVITK